VQREELAVEIADLMLAPLDGIFLKKCEPAFASCFLAIVIELLLARVKREVVRQINTLRVFKDEPGFYVANLGARRK
jgi:hypothetical protein